MYGGMYGGLGMNRFGNDNYSSSGFAQQAELSSRQAFQSIESVVHAVGSVAAMLDSTFQAVYNSFRAVIGVADHMSRLSAHLKRIFSTFALFRIIRWLTSWLLAVVRLQHPSNTDDQMWSRAAEEVLVTGAAKTDILGENRSNWPVMLFFAIVVGGPWLLWKFLSSFDRGTDKKGWASGAEDHYVAVAEYDFSGQSDDELSFKQGATITVAPKEVQPNIRGWLLASLNGQKIGLIPANYVRILGKRRGSHLCHSADTNSKSTESLPVGLSHWDKDFTMQTSSCVSDSLSS
jgi:peroxin-13